MTTSGEIDRPVPATGSTYRFLLIQAFQLPADSPYLHRGIRGSKEQTLMNYDALAPMLADVDWDLHPGALTTYGNWAVETREEFCYSAAARLPIVRDACASG